MSEERWPFGYGYCCCGCGEQTRIAPWNDTWYGRVAGEPMRYINGHGRATRQATLQRVFWSKVDRSDPDGCWPWLDRTWNGYGAIRVEGKLFRAHRIAYTLEYGEIPEGLIVRHLCNNPSCCRPDHLEVGTNQDNSNDMVEAERQERGEDKWSAVLTEKEVLDIYMRCMRGGETQGEIASDYRISRATVSRISTGRSWQWLTGAGDEDA